MMDPAPDSPPPPERATNGFYRVFRIIVVTIGGLVTILVGIAMLVLPGPGLLVIFSGIGILAVEYAWANHLFHGIRIRAEKIWKWIWKKRDKPDE